MAIVKFITSGCPMNNIFPYVTRDEATEQRLIGGIGCSPDTAFEEFRYIKQKYGKEDGRSYYHIVQSFSPDDNLTPETAHEIGLKFAEYFPGFQILVATHCNTGNIHNHLIMNSVSYENGKKFHQSRDGLLQVKAYSNKLCQEYGLSVTEEKCSYGKLPEWKKMLRRYALFAISNSDTKEEFIACMREHGYKVKWEDKYKYITFTTLDGVNSELYDEYMSYTTPAHKKGASMTVTTGLISMLGDLLSIVPPESDFEPHPVKELNTAEKLRLEKILGRKISPRCFACYSTQEEYEQGMSLIL